MSVRLNWELINARLSAIDGSAANALQPGPEEIERVYRERAVRLAGASNKELERQGEPVMLFLIGRERYAIELAHLAGVIRLQSVTAIPGTPRHIAGVINVRGEVCPLLDLKALLQVASAPENARYALLINRNKGTFSLRVDKVEGVEQFSREAAESVDGSPYIRFRTAGGEMLLSADALVNAMGEIS